MYALRVRRVAKKASMSEWNKRGSKTIMTTKTKLRARLFRRHQQQKKKKKKKKKQGTK